MTAPARNLVNLGLFLAGLALGGAGVAAWDHVRTPEATAATDPMRSWEATVYLPLNDNHGRTFADEEWQSALEILVDGFGGATLGERREGFWKNEQGRICHDWIRPVTVSFPRHRLDEFRRKLHEVGNRLGQDALYVRFEEPRIELIGKSPE